MVSAFFGTLGVILGVAVIAILVAVCLIKGVIDIVAWLVGKFRNAGKRSE